VRVALAAALAFTCLPFASAGADDEMASYQFVMFERGPNRGSFGERDAQARQEAHLQRLDALLRQGRVAVHGPIADSGDLREVLVLEADSPDAARELFRDDPWLAAGRLELNVLTLWAAKGILRPIVEDAGMTTAVLGLFVRPPDAPDYPEEKLAELQRGHLENMGRMERAGRLVWAGPFEGDQALRGILLFRGTELETLRNLLSEDPSVKAGRLGVQLFRWRVPRGVLPD
jgi:uncharacterized protein YciI